jgi:hypothetical protein
LILWWARSQVIIPWEVLDGELNVRVVVNEHGLNLGGWREEEGLMRGQLLEHHTWDWGLSWPKWKR